MLFLLTPPFLSSFPLYNSGDGGGAGPGGDGEEEEEEEEIQGKSVVVVLSCPPMLFLLTPPFLSSSPLYNIGDGGGAGPVVYRTSVFPLVRIL